jgi:predicted neutral ceramidase superfamily lipid hydrolase
LEKKRENCEGDLKANVVLNFKLKFRGGNKSIDENFRNITQTTKKTSCTLINYKTKLENLIINIIIVQVQFNYYYFLY